MSLPYDYLADIEERWMDDREQTCVKVRWQEGVPTEAILLYGHGGDQRCFKTAEEVDRFVEMMTRNWNDMETQRIEQEMERQRIEATNHTPLDTNIDLSDIETSDPIPTSLSL